MTTWSRFKTDQSGATAMIFGLALIPVMAFAGGAIDYSRASSGRAQLQKAVDATALALVREAGSLNDRQLRKRGEEMFSALMKDARMVAAETPSITRDARTIRVSATGTVKTAVLGVAGFNEIAIGSEAQSSWGAKRIELALVLDNTGSMASQNKMRELKKAVENLLAGLKQAAADDEAIKVSIVPFDTHVRVDADPNAPWLKFQHPSDKAKWKGYVADRAAPYDAGDAAPADRDMLYPASDRSDSDLARVLPLTSAVSGYRTLTNRVDEMRPKGCTNITIGTSWGLATLSNGAPMTGASNAPNVEKIMIVLTDGDNTQNARWTTAGCGGRDPVSRIDDRTRAACQSVKDAGVTLYTIRVIEGNAGLLKSCASLGKYGQPLYSDVDNAAQIQPVFQRIMNEILATRLTV